MTPRPKMTMAPIKKKTRLYEDIVQQFVRKIEDGEMKAGDRLPTERDLVEQLGVSRTSIREALRAMELLGIIESRGSEGTFVKATGTNHALFKLTASSSADEKQVLEMYQARMLLEPFIAREAARRRTDGQLAEMRDTLAVMTRDIASGGRGRVQDNRFHKLISEAAGNSVLIGILSLFAESLDSSITIANAHVNVNDIIDEHRRMLEAIERGDEKSAERLMRAHIKRAYDRTQFIISAKAEKE